MNNGISNMSNRRLFFAIPMALALFVLVAMNDPGAFDRRTSRSLATRSDPVSPETRVLVTNTQNATLSADENNHGMETNTTRNLQQYTFNPYLQHNSRPPQVALYCHPGAEKIFVDWSSVGFNPALPRGAAQALTLSNGKKLSMKVTENQCSAKLPSYENGKIKSGIQFVVYPAWIPNNTPGNQGGIYGPNGYSWTVDTSAVVPFPSTRFYSIEYEFEEAVDSAFFSVGGITSDTLTSSVVRITMSDIDGSPNDLYIARTGTNLRVSRNYAYQWEAWKQRSDDPSLSSLYAKSNSRVKKIRVDQTAFTFISYNVNTGFASGVDIFPGLDFGFCAPKSTPPPTPVPTPPPTPPPTPDPLVPNPAGTSGDPIIMGLSGQIFKFNGRSGAWYSAASAKSFQWNMKIQQFEGCPNGSETFITGVGLTLYADQEKKQKEHKISINVVNEYSTGVGCGNRWEKNQDFGCLGAGSLELMIDGHKIVQGIDHQFHDQSGHVIAFNTISKCSRRWFDFDVTPSGQIGGVEQDEDVAALLRGRELKNKRGANVLEILEGVKDTMVDKEGCEAWMKERKTNGDLFKQTGTWSTIMIKTDKISFHIEYKQEQERCDAHSIDVWISEVSPDVLDEDWEGVIGETKNKSWKRTEPKHVDRAVALKYADDESYEVLSPFSNKCKACHQK